MKKKLLLLFVGLTTIAFSQENVKYAETIIASDLEKHLIILASDSLEGRETGTIGEQLALEYLGARLKDIGVKAQVHKFEFNGRSYTKNRLVLEVVRHTVDVKKVENIDKLKSLFPDSYWSEGKESSSKNAFIVELKKDAENKRARFFTKKDDIIKFDNSNAEVIVNNQWGTNFDYFLDKVSTELNYEIKRHGPKQ